MGECTQFKECQWELGPLATDLRLKLSASFWEDETGTIPAASIVSASETFYVMIKWALYGHLKRHFCGKWKVKVDFESIGPRKDFESKCVTIDMDPCKDDPYRYVFPITWEDVQPHECGTVYIVAVTLSSLDPCGKPGHIWGFCKGPSVMFVP